MKKHSTIRRKFLTQGKSYGFTLVEILVGVMIGLIGTIVIFQVFAVSESQKRTTTSSGDAQQNGTFALYSLEQEIRNAGGGLGGLNTVTFKCNVLAYSATASPSTTFNFPLVPIMITDGGTGVNNSDRISLMYGTSSLNSTALGFKTSAAPTDDYSITSNQGFGVGDLILAMENTKVTPYPSCTLAQVSALPSGGTNISHGAVTGMTYNKPSGLGVTYSASSSLINLGNPIVTEYYVDATSGELRSHAVLNGTSTASDTPIVNTVVNMQAQYGVDTNGDDVIDAWQEPTGTWAASALTATQISRIKAIRIAVITRSLQLEKTDVSPATINVFADAAAGVAASAVTITLPSRRFRYQTFETVVPIRNVIWNY